MCEANLLYFWVVVPVLCFVIKTVSSTLSFWPQICQFSFQCLSHIWDWETMAYLFLLEKMGVFIRSGFKLHSPGLERWLSNKRMPPHRTESWFPALLPSSSLLPVTPGPKDLTTLTSTDSHTHADIPTQRNTYVHIILKKIKKWNIV